MHFHFWASINPIFENHVFGAVSPYKRGKNGFGRKLPEICCRQNDQIFCKCFSEKFKFQTKLKIRSHHIQNLKKITEVLIKRNCRKSACMHSCQQVKEINTFRSCTPECPVIKHQRLFKPELITKQHFKEFMSD